jgi:ACS family tartrate transporter-like MFS transporter
LVGAGVAAGLAAVNSVGNLGGFIGPYLLGSLTEWLGSTTAGIGVLGGCIAVAGGLIAATCKGYGLRMTESEAHGE